MCSALDKIELSMLKSLKKSCLKYPIDCYFTITTQVAHISQLQPMKEISSSSLSFTCYNANTYEITSDVAGVFEAIDVAGKIANDLTRKPLN